MSTRALTSDAERDCVNDIQRARMVAAMAEECVARGVGNVTVAHVVSRSGVSRRTFYELFADREACFLAAFDESARRLSEQIAGAYRSAGTWRARIRAALTALLVFCEVDPRAGRLLTVESLAGGPAVLQRRNELLERAAIVVDGGRAQARSATSIPELAAEGALGAILGVVQARLLQVPPAPLVGLASELTSMIVLPYLGPAAAREELRRPPPRIAPVADTDRRGALMQLEMRLTYRTIRVLMSIAAHPGSSNRQVATAAEVADQGQMSKLLARLRKLELIEKAGGARGEPNAWVLTQKGWEVQSALAAQGV